MSIEKEIKKKYIKNRNTMKIMAYDPYNFPASNDDQQVWKYGQTVYVTPVNNNDEFIDPFFFTHKTSLKVIEEETINFNY